MKYNLPDCWEVLNNPPTKFSWKSLAAKQVNMYWADKIRRKASFYSSRWPPCPYMVKTLKNLLLQNQNSFGSVSWYKALGTQDLPSLFK